MGEAYGIDYVRGRSRGWLVYGPCMHARHYTSAHTHTPSFLQSRGRLLTKVHPRALPGARTDQETQRTTRLPTHAPLYTHRYNDISHPTHYSPKSMPTVWRRKGQSKNSTRCASVPSRCPGEPQCTMGGCRGSAPRPYTWMGGWRDGGSCVWGKGGRNKVGGCSGRCGFSSELPYSRGACRCAGR